MRVTFRGLLKAATILTVLVSAVTMIPVDHAALQLFTHFRLQYLAVSLVLLVALAGVREPRYAVALVFAAILNALPVVPWYSDDPVDHDGTEYTVVLANVHSGNDDYEKLFNLVAVEEPDVLVLLEVSPRWAQQLVRLEADYPERVVEAREGNFGIAMFSKLPMASAATIDSAPLDYPTIVAAIEFGDATVHVIGTHPMIPLGRAFYDARNTQLDGIARLLQHADGPRLLVGDLNLTMWDVNYAAFENRTWLRNVRRGFGVKPTWPTFLPVAMIPIDHVLVSEEFGVRAVRTGARIGSDHLPLVVTLTL
ncbi:MAG TPA: endonuclease/exonuclease/phosphatase family protein [Woeseiaceae bacterium]|jgi:endonuclease/exonuclease/phosphatase (EEP) superfamily protein YafD|nr:endonuclease/exonuclease/phosphatase family protein [Woeseiaceae bacterium]